MSHTDIVDIVEEMGYPMAYDHFAEGESPDPPFLLFLFPRNDDFKADGENYFPITVVHFELYTDKKQPEAEQKVEQVLRRHHLVYSKSETWIPEEKLYEVLYETEVTWNG